MEHSSVPIGRRGRGAPLPRRGWPGEPGPAARLPLRHDAADRRGLRAAPASCRLGRCCDRPERRHRIRTARASAILFYRAHHASGQRPVRRTTWRTPIDATGQAVGRADLLLLAARRRAGAARRARHARRADRHRARRRWHRPATPPERRRRRRGVGRRGARAARHPDPAGAVPDQGPGRLGRRPTKASPRSMRRPRSPCRSSTAGSSRCAFSFKETRRARAAPLRHRRRALSPRRRHRGRACPPAARARLGEEDRAGAVGVPDQAQPRRQRRRSRHPGLGRPPAARAARARATTSATPDFIDLADDTDDTRPATALIHALIDARRQDEDWLTSAQLTEGQVRIPADDYRLWFAHLPADLREAMTEPGGRRPDRCSSTRPARSCCATLQARQRGHPDPAAPRVR